jgi:hypothetical protein
LNEKNETNVNFRLALKRVEIDFPQRLIKAISHDGKTVYESILTFDEMMKDAI